MLTRKYAACVVASKQQEKATCRARITDQTGNSPHLGHSLHKLEYRWLRSCPPPALWTDRFIRRIAACCADGMCAAGSGGGSSAARPPRRTPRCTPRRRRAGCRCWPTPPPRRSAAGRWLSHFTPFCGGANLESRYVFNCGIVHSTALYETALTCRYVIAAGQRCVAHHTGSVGVRGSNPLSSTPS